MRKLCSILMVCLCVTVFSAHRADAQILIADVIKGGVKKVIKAVDLEVQRLQNKTVALQNAQKVIENTMSKMHLEEITGWVQKQKDLYADYYNELRQVKNIITYYHRIQEITEKQKALIREYQRAWNMLRQDPHFSTDEIDYMAQVYSGILEATLQHTDQLLGVVKAFTMQMSDADRIAVINRVGRDVDEDYDDLHRFNRQNELVSLSRAKNENDARIVQWMYGL